MSLEIAPAHVFGLVTVLMASILGFMIKVSKCIGKIEKSAENNVEEIRSLKKAFISHLDKKI